MSFLIKGMVIKKRNLVSVVLFLLLWFPWAATFRSSVIFLFAESGVGVPSYFAFLIPLSVAPALVLGGFFLDRVRKRKPFFLLFFIWGAISFLPIIFPTPAIIPVYLVATGALSGLTGVAAFSFLADNTEVYERGRVAGSCYAAFGFLGIMVTLASQQSVNLYFGFFGVWAFVLGLVGLFLTREPISFEEWRRIPTSNIFGDRNFLIFAGLAAAIGFFWGANLPLVSSYVGGALPDPRVTFWNANRLSIAGFGFFIGFLVDRVGRRPVIVMGPILFASGFMLAAFANNPWSLLLTATIFGVAYACLYISAVYVILGDLSRKESRGRFYGIGLVALVLGSLTGAQIGQFLLNSSTLIVIIFLLFTSFMLILPAMITRETLPPKERIEEMRDYIKSIKDKAKKDEG